MFATDPTTNGSWTHRCAAIAAFVVSGLLSTWAFVSVTKLPPLDGASNLALKITISLAWIAIFPLWIGLYLCLMLLVALIEEILHR